jgi:spore maturation protein CgeB
MGYWRDIASRYDYFFASRRGNSSSARRGRSPERRLPADGPRPPEGPRRVELLPGEREEFGGDVSFVGAGYYNRRRMFEG